VLVFSLAISILSGFYDEYKIVINGQASFLAVFWSLFLTQALIYSIFVYFVSSDLSDKLRILIPFFVLTPIIATGLPFWLFMALISLWQYRAKNNNEYNEVEFLQTVPFRWQTFAYPLPSLANYLFQLGQHDIQTALTAIKLTKYKTLQGKAVKTAIVRLASHPMTAFNFCTEFCLQFNSNTVKQLALTSSLGRSIACLLKQQEKEDEEALEFYLGEVNEQIPKLYLAIFRANKDNTVITKFIAIRQQPLLARLSYAQEQLKNCQNYVSYAEISKLLQAYQQYLIQDFIDIPTVTFVQFDTTYQQVWLKLGWSSLNEVISVLAILKDYVELSTQSARQEFLIQIIATLKDLDRSFENKESFFDHYNRFKNKENFSEIPDYWKNISIELSQHWIILLEKEISRARVWLKLEKEISQARVWLKLDIKIEKLDYLLGRQNLLLRVINPTTTTARNICIQVEDNKAITWHHKEIYLKFLETQLQQVVQLEFECQETGEYRIKGLLTAEDISGIPYQLPFAFQITVGKKGKPYQIPDFQPYIIGAGLGDDRTFVERTELFHWLHSYWKQPQGKAAIALMGQRRMGKTSILNKIQRSGLAELNLIPGLIDMQDGIENDYVFLNKTAQKMGEASHQAIITLPKENSYAAFEDYLQTLKPQLANRRFLLMLDEAELIFNTRFTSQLADFLRALMQGHQHPVLLLFCGTYLLKNLSREYHSILFNTVEFKKISYMNAQESAEVLTKPTTDILQYDPDSLKTAYALTNGQPLLLQTIGKHIIENFKEAVWNGEERGHYVDLNDLDLAVDTLIKNGSPAFEQHWEHNQGAAHYVLSALAWAIDEINRPRLDQNGLLAIMQQKSLLVPDNEVFTILERLTEEEILVRENVAYRFAVPLYRRWIAWRWSPELVRNEPLVDAPASSYSNKQRWSVVRRIPTQSIGTINNQAAD